MMIAHSYRPRTVAEEINRQVDVGSLLFRLQHGHHLAQEVAVRIAPRHPDYLRAQEMALDDLDPGKG